MSNVETTGKTTKRAAQKPASTPTESAPQPPPDPVPEPEPEGELRHIHFVEDGLTAFGTVWHKGQELKMRSIQEDGTYTGDIDFMRTVDRNGKSWMDLDENAQTARWSKVFFRAGPWPGKPSEDKDYIDAEKKRAGSAPPPSEPIGAFQPTE